VIGGIGRIEGPLVGALVFWALNKFFSDYGTWYLLGLGLLAIVCTIYFKQGLWGFAQQRWGWTLLPTSRTLKMLSREALITPVTQGSQGHLMQRIDEPTYTRTPT
jgi:branched-chain amino acid transport system permease protein